MRRIPLFLLILLASTVLAGPALAADLPDVDRLAGEIVRICGWGEGANTQALEPLPPDEAATIAGFERTVLHGNVAHYRLDVRIGTGPYDVIRLHRVVKETRPFRPIRTAKTIFLLHGDCVGFVKFIFGSVTPNLPDDQSIASFLAKENIDVWGMDQPWALVPGGLPDYSFAAGWGVQYNIDALRAGLSLARVTRLLTGSGHGKMLLLGYSSGALTGYAYLNEESQRPLRARNVSGFVAADIFYKYDRSDPDLEAARQIVCFFKDYYQDMQDQGLYDLGYGNFFITVGSLAETAPDDPSPIYPGMTNREAALFMGAVPEAATFTPWYHYVAGEFEEGNPIPVDLRFTSTGAWYDFLQTASPFEPTLFAVDYTEIACDETDVPFDDHLADITVPVLHLAANGGIGRAGFYTLELLGSTDKTIVNVSVTPPEIADFAHIDLWAAENAPDVAWPSLLAWIEDHSGTPLVEEGAGQAIAEARAPVADPTLRVSPSPGRTNVYTFSFDMPASGEATVEIFDVAGRRVAAPLSCVSVAGHNQVVWKTAAREGRLLGPGVYFARVTTPNGIRTAKFVHLGP